MKHPIARLFRDANVDLTLLGGPLRNGNREIFQMDILRSHRSECIRIWPGDRANSLRVTSIEPEQRQLVLQVREPVRTFTERVDRVGIEGRRARPPKLRSNERILQTADTYYEVERRTDGNLRRFLCGMDESHYFVAQFREGGTVAEAHASLRPPEVDQAERREPGSTVRQGEWFFVPPASGELESLQAWLRGSARQVLYKAPVGAGANPHTADQVVHRDQPRGWRVERRTYACGSVRHRDHAAVQLPGWRRVLRNLEVTSSQVGDNGVFWFD